MVTRIKCDAGWAGALKAAKGDAHGWIKFKYVICSAIWSFLRSHGLLGNFDLGLSQATAVAKSASPTSMQWTKSLGSGVGQCGVEHLARCWEELFPKETVRNQQSSPPVCSKTSLTGWEFPLTHIHQEPHPHGASLILPLHPGELVPVPQERLNVGP